MDALSYTELEKYGFGKLVQPIMDAGGYAAVSKALGATPSARRARRPCRPTTWSGRARSAAFHWEAPSRRRWRRSAS